MLVAVLLALAGFLLIYLELYVPGGILGVLGGVALVFSLTFFVWEKKGIMWDSLYAILLVIFVALTIKLALYRIKKNRHKNTIYANQDQEGFFASSYNKDLIGKGGIAESDLKPSGHVSIEGKREQAVSEGGYIKKGERVTVISGEGARLIVRKEEQ